MALLGCVIVASRAVGSEADARAAVEPDLKAAPLAEQPAGQAVMRAYFDPKTGKLGAPPAGQAAPPTPAAGGAERRARSTSAQGLTVVPAPGGGMMVDLQGRFQSEVTATLKPDGTVVTDCEPKGSAAAAAVGR